MNQRTSKSALPAITAPQSDARIPKPFQAQIIANLCAKMLSPQRPPCLLRSPTGSGKTFMLTRVLQIASDARPTLWLWFVPYVTLVAQTQDSIDSEGAGLVAQQLTAALNEEPAAGLVLISTVQGVASGKERKAGYAGNEDDQQRSLASYFQRARSAGFSIGCVVDEAHIALKSTTEFGQFVQWLAPDHLLMATATPKDEKLSQFITASGYSHYETFSVSRTDVVAARLNKKWIETAVYDLRESMRGITDLQLTVLRRAWRRNQSIERELRSRGLATAPLMLVQVGNGDKTVEEAIEFLNKELLIPLAAIGQHSAEEPDPVMMAAIANDSSKQVLVFKQAAGTGFDAPRAFVLASTKPVNDADFATQFIGRVMRVPSELQKAFPNSEQVPADLDTAFIFLANAQAQAGFSQAADSIKAVKSELEGQTEALHLRRTAYGGVALTNRVTPQVPLIYDLSLLPTVAGNGERLAASTLAGEETTNAFNQLPIGTTVSLFDDSIENNAPDQIVDEPVTPPAKDSVVRVTAAAKPRKAPTTFDELLDAFSEAGIRSVRRSVNLRVPASFVTEVPAEFEAFTLDVEAAVKKLPIDVTLQNTAIQAALDRMKERELYTELFTGQTREEEVQVVTDADALLEITIEKLESLGLEEQDAIDAIATMGERLMGAIEQAVALQDDAIQNSSVNRRSKARQAACWVIHKRFAELEELLFAQLAGRAKEQPAKALPEALLIPGSVSLAPSPKNTYGIMFPSRGEVTTARDALRPEAKVYFRSDDYVLNESIHSVVALDATFELNEQETRFAKALDRAEFVHWWHRNPQGKPFSVGLVRADSEKLFYPDFVVCMEHVTGERPLLRLIDPKHDTKDAKRKAEHVSSFYGRVLFLTKDADRFKVVNEDGTVGEVVDFDDLSAMKDWMRSDPPRHQFE
jgi:type III restriction enzyme